LTHIKLALPRSVTQADSPDRGLSAHSQTGGPFGSCDADQLQTISETTQAHMPLECDEMASRGSNPITETSPLGY
jgi:hypothetical protein